MKKNNVSKGIFIGAIACALVLIGILGTYAYFITAGTKQEEKVTVQTGNISLIFTDGTDGFQGSLNFGESAIKTFTIENNGTLDTTAVMNFDNLINTYTLGSLTYTLEYATSESGEFTKIVENQNVPRSEEQSSRTLASNLSIPAGKKYYYKLTITLNYLDDIDQTSDLNALFSTNFKLAETNNPALETVLALGLKPREGTPDFANVATTDETSDELYAMEDDYGTSYYFRGATENNYVKFAGFYWRIIRINGDGTLRLIYDGTGAHANGESNNDRVAFNSVWNSAYDDNKYLGYMYGGTKGVASTSKEQAQSNETDSDMKIALDNWYKTNIEDKNYSKYIADSIFCNDRKVSDDLTLKVGQNGINSGLGYGTNHTLYESSARPENVSLICEQQNDKFTVNDTTLGNGDLTYPIGLLTYDEFQLAGSGWSRTDFQPQNTSFYLYKGVWQWTFTPSYFGYWNSTGTISFGHNYLNYWDYDNDRSYSNNGVAPVINIKIEYAQKMMGNGTMTNPYRIKETEFQIQEAVNAIKNNRTPEGVREGMPNFATIATTDEGVYAMEDDYGTSYYYRGAVENNYVKFAGFYWRIIRVNGDGSLRIIYDGEQAYKNGISDTARSAVQNTTFNTNYDDAKDAGYMYSPAGTIASTSKEEAQTNTENSTIKIAIDNWYKTNIVDKNYSKYISDKIFCNDRSIPGKSTTGWSIDTGLGYGNNITAYGAFSRFVTGSLSSRDDPIPTFKCINKNDSFTVVETEKGNGALEYPVGLITGDETIAAGSGKKETDNLSYYLYKGHSYWALTPYSKYYTYTDVGAIGVNGQMSSGPVNSTFAIAPVINLSTETIESLIGTGTMTDSYRLSTE